MWKKPSFLGARSSHPVVNYSYFGQTPLRVFSSVSWDWRALWIASQLWNWAKRIAGKQPLTHLGLSSLICKVGNLETISKFPWVHGCHGKEGNKLSFDSIICSWFYSWERTQASRQSVQYCCITAHQPWGKPHALSFQRSPALISADNLER